MFGIDNQLNLLVYTLLMSTQYAKESTKQSGKT